MRYQILLFLGLLSISGFAQTEGKKVLFLGNSYTFSNNLPDLFKNLSNAAGDTITAGFNTPGGYTLQGHSTNQMSQDMINQGDWDFVVLQEQSQLPSFPLSQVQTQCFPYAAKLDTMINAVNPCTETVFFMTWGRENGDAGNCPNWPPVCTYQGMDSLLYDRYMQMAEDNNAIVSPVGAVWRFIRTNMSSINLYDQDGSHPSAAGSYAAACAFYSIIHRKNPVNVPYDFTLNVLEAYQIRQAAKLVVFDSLEKWFVGSYDSAVLVDAEFQSAQSQLNATFNNLSTNATSVFWEFGDETTSANLNPSHTYPGSGQYTVTLTAFHCDSSDTAMQTLNFETTPIDTADTTINDTITRVGIIDASYIQVFPNPTINRLNISGLQYHNFRSLELIDIFGRKVAKMEIAGRQGMEIDMSNLDSGLYIMHLTGKDGSIQKAVIVQ